MRHDDTNGISGKLPMTGKGSESEGHSSVKACWLEEQDDGLDTEKICRRTESNDGYWLGKKGVRSICEPFHVSRVVK